MRKFTLFFASLLITIGAMAQTPVVTVTEIGNAPYQLNDEDATKIFELDDLTIFWMSQQQAHLVDAVLSSALQTPHKLFPKVFQEQTPRIWLADTMARQSRT